MNKELKFAVNAVSSVVDSWMPLKIKYDRTPGAVVCIAHKGKPMYLRAFGSQDLEGKKKLSKDALFRVASMSKMFTAVAIMKLQEQGALRIDDKVSNYLPWFAGKNKISDLKNVTVRHVLSHASGVFRDGEDPHWVTGDFPKTLKSTISTKAIVIENLTGFKYSNHAFAILGNLIEVASGLSYDAYVTKYILKPLSLKDMQPDLYDEIPVKLIEGYERFIPDKSNREKYRHTKTFSYAPATGFISNAGDLALFLSSLSLNAPKSVIGRESKKEMLRTHGKPNCDDEYGLGFDIYDVDGRLVVGHSGGYLGFFTNALTSVEDNIQVIVLANTISGTAWNVSDSIMRMLYKISGKTSSYGGKKLLGKKYEGTYRNLWGDTVIASVGEKLVSFSPQANDPISCWTMLEHQKTHTFLDSNKTGFGSVREPVIFSEFKNGIAQKLFVGSTPSNRILQHHKVDSIL